MAAITTTNLPLKLIAKGKVRDVYDAEITDGPHAGAILFVATDRISAFDIILQNVSCIHSSENEREADVVYVVEIRVYQRRESCCMH